MKYMLRIIAIAIVIQFSLKISIAQTTQIGAPYIGSKEILYNGLKLQDEKKYAESIVEFQKIHPGDSSYKSAVFEKSYSYYSMDSFNKAISIAEEIINSPSYEYKNDCYGIKINALESLKQYDNAHKICDEAITYFPYITRFYIEKGEVYEQQENYEDAYKQYTIAITLNPLNSRVHLNLGRLYSKMDLPALSILAYQTFLLTSTNANSMNGGLSEMEVVCRNQNEPNLIIAKKFKVGFENIEELDLVLKSQAALDKKFKSKIKLSFLSNKQLQLISEMIVAGISLNDFPSKFYLDFYAACWNEKHFEGLILSGFRTVENDLVEKERRSKKKIEDAFLSWANNYTFKYFTREVLMDGKQEKLTFSYKSGNLNAIGKYNEEEKKVGEWKYYYPSGALSIVGNYKNDIDVGLWTYYYEDGTLKKQLTLNDAREKDGYYRFYDSNGQLIDDYSFKNDKIDGKTSIYRVNGSLKFSGYFKDDIVVDYKRFYSEYSKLSSLQAYKDDKLNGLVINFDDDSVVLSRINFVNDLREGEAEYFVKGKLNSKGKFVNDKYEGDWTWYHPNGKVNYVIPYKNDLQNGTINYYDEFGKLYEVTTYENGKLNGITKKFDKKERLVYEVNYKKNLMLSYKVYDTLGKIIFNVADKSKSVYVKVYNDYRQLVSEGLLVDNYKEGEWINYYANGSIESKISYKKDSKEGIATYLYMSGVKESEVMYVNDKREGYCQNYFFNGNIKSNGYFLDDQAIGVWKYFYINGNVNSTSYYINNNLNGVNDNYEYDGTLYSKTYYNNGLFYKVEQFNNKGILYNTSSIKPGNGKITFKAPCNTITKVNNYLYGKLEGERIAVGSNGNIVEKARFKNGNLEGNYSSYNVFTKELVTTGNYKNDNKEGEWVNYRYGKLSSKENYEEGKRKGLRIYYNENAGFVERRMNYVDNAINGEYFVYTSANDLAIKLYFENEVLTKYTYLNEKNEFVPYIPVVNETAHIVAYYPNKQKSIDYNIKKGCLEGDYIQYYTDGKIYSKETYEKNELNGVLTNYFPNGNPSEEVVYTNGILNGYRKLYYPNGKLMYSLNFLNDEYHGVLTYYNEKGEVISSANFKYGVGCE